MAQKSWSDGEEIIFEDLNDGQTHVRSELYDRVIYHMLQKQGLGFFQDSFFVDFQDGTHVSVRAGCGFQLDNAQVSPEPKRRLYYIPANSIKTLASPDGTNPRIDLICTKAIRADSLTESRNIKDGITGIIAAANVVTETDWLSDIVVVQGTPAGSPVAPAVPSGYQKIATLHVAAVSGLASQSSIDDERAIIPVADEAYIDTTGFPAVVTPSLTARLKDVLLELASFEINHDSAAEIPAGNGGHGVATGTTVQDQLDELDLLLTEFGDVASALHGAFLIAYKYAVSGDWDVTKPVNTAQALDQLAARVRLAESGTNIGAFVAKSFNDYVVPADDPTIGSGNTGLTDTLARNPRGLKFGDLRTLFGEERIVFMDIKRTGNFDSSGKPEWAVMTPVADPRVRLYGNWSCISSGPAGIVSTSVGAGSVDGNWQIKSGSVGDYFLVTGVFDAIGLNLAKLDVGYSNDIEVEIDTVNTGAPLSAQGALSPLDGQGNNFTTVSNTSMQGLGHDIHTVKFIQNDGVNLPLKINGVSLITSVATQMPGKLYLNKVVTAFATKNTISAPSVTNKGGKILRYVDPADSLIKDVVNNAFVFESVAAGSISASSTGFSVADASQMQSGDILLITDGPTNSEKVLANSVNTGSGAITIPSPGLVNSYSSPTVSVYGRALAITNHANEQIKAIKNITSMGNCDNNGYDSPNQNIATEQRVWIADDGASGVNTDANWSSTSPAGFNNFIGLYPTINSAVWYHYFKGTGLDVLFDAGSAPTGVWSVIIDGVLVGTLTFAAFTTKWYKICSDLPEGNHVVQLVSGASGNVDVGICEFIEWETKLPATPGGVNAGNIISNRTKNAAYLFDSSAAITLVDTAPYPRRAAISRGVVRQHFYRGAKFVDGTGGSSAWAGGLINPLHPTGIYFGTDKTNAYVEKWFFGTGVDVRMSLDPANGIAQIKVDGLNATATNFPGATFQDSAGGFNSSSGLFDGYGVTNSLLMLSMAGLSATPSWHLLRIQNTGTKNGSSSSYNITVSHIEVHDMPFESEMPNEIIGGCSELFMGGILDKRRKSAEDDGVKFPNYCRGVKVGAYASTNTTASPNGRMIAKIKTQGYPIKVMVSENYANATSAGNIFTIMINGRPYQATVNYEISAGYQWNAVMTLGPIKLPAGFYAIQLYEAAGGGTLSTSTGGEISVEELVPQRRA